MDEGWEEVEYLRITNARHKKKGFRLQEITAAQTLTGACEELYELEQAEANETEENQLNEFADLMCILMDYAQRKRWSKEQIDQAMINKLKLRFTIE